MRLLAVPPDLLPAPACLHLLLQVLGGVGVGVGTTMSGGSMDTGVGGKGGKTTLITREAGGGNEDGVVKAVLSCIGQLVVVAQVRGRGGVWD